MKPIKHPMVREVIGDREAFWKAFKEELEKPESERKVVLWNEIGTILLDESSMQTHTTVKELLCYLKFGKCDPKTMEIYERLKSKEETK